MKRGSASIRLEAACRMHARHLLITGRPGVGKTTVVRALAERLAGYRPAEFYTQELREGGLRKGFQVVALDGRSRLLSHVDFPGPCRIGRYGVDIEGFENLLRELDLSHSRSRVILIDEIGKMECSSRRFCDEVRALFQSTKTVVATVALRGAGFIAEVKQRPDCLERVVTVQNRDRLPDELLPWIERALDRSRENET